MSFCTPHPAVKHTPVMLCRASANSGTVLVAFVPDHLSCRRFEATVSMLASRLFCFTASIGEGLRSISGVKYGPRSCTHRPLPVWKVLLRTFLEDRSTFTALLKAIPNTRATKSRSAQLTVDKVVRVWQCVAYTAHRLQREGPSIVASRGDLGEAKGVKF
jgi:hypothetical protein